MPIEPLEAHDLIQIVALLASGLTDRDIAGKLSLSERTVRRRIAALCQDLGAASRFQAGILLAPYLAMSTEPPPTSDSA